MTNQPFRKGRETTYAGVRFRSALEARWAAFFDCAGWKWSYEPDGVPGYIPDFLILSGFDPFYIEVKSEVCLVSLSAAFVEQVEPKITREALPEEEEERVYLLDKPMLLVGEHPVLLQDEAGTCSPGWFITPPEGNFHRCRWGGKTGMGVQVVDNSAWKDILASQAAGIGESRRWIEEQWAKATNLTQWRKRS